MPMQRQNQIPAEKPRKQTLSQRLRAQREANLGLVKLPPNESGAVWDSENSNFPLGKVSDKRGRALDGEISRKTLGRKLALARKQAKAELEDDIKQLKHPLSLDILTRFEIREKFHQGISAVKLAREYKTSVSVVRGVLHMAENLPTSREEELTRQFLRMSSVMRDILRDVPQTKIRNASLHAQIASAAVLSDKILAIRRSLDGEAAKRVELAALPSFHDRESMIEAIKQKMEYLRPVLEVEAHVVQEISAGEVIEEESPQLFLFPTKEQGSE